MQVIFAALPGRSYSPQANRVPFKDLLAVADVVSLHCPLTKENAGLISTEELKLMKKSAILVNTARGALVDEHALKKALQSRMIAGAATDVLSVEPPVDGNVLLDEGIPNLIVTPHVAWIACESRQRLIDQVAGNIKAFLDGKPQNQVV